MVHLYWLFVGTRPLLTAVSLFQVVKVGLIESSQSPTGECVAPQAMEADPHGELYTYIRETDLYLKCSVPAEKTWLAVTAPPAAESTAVSFQPVDAVTVLLQEMQKRAWPSAWPSPPRPRQLTAPPPA